MADKRRKSKRRDELPPLPSGIFDGANAAVPRRAFGARKGVPASSAQPVRFAPVRATAGPSVFPASAPPAAPATGRGTFAASGRGGSVSGALTGTGGDRLAGTGIGNFGGDPSPAPAAATLGRGVFRPRVPASSGPSPALAFGGANAVSGVSCAPAGAGDAVGRAAQRTLSQRIDGIGVGVAANDQFGH